jgi:hypothetical protein
MRRAATRTLLASVLSATSLLAACEGAAGPSPSPPLASPSLAPRPSSPASVDTTPSPTPPVEGDQLSEVGCCYGTELAPGRYAAPRFVPLWVSLELGSGWRGIRSGNDRIFAFVRGRNDIGHSTHFLAIFGVDAATRDAFLDALDTTPKLRVGELRPVTIAGLEGSRLDAEAQPNPEVAGTDERIAGAVLVPGMTALTNPFLSWFTESPRAKLRIYVLRATDEHDLLVYVEAPREEFSSFAGEVEGALATLQVAPR